jgi:hypothetical protein
MTIFAAAYLIVALTMIFYLVRLGARQRRLMRAWHESTILRQQERSRCC